MRAAAASIQRRLEAVGRDLARSAAAAEEAVTGRAEAHAALLAERERRMAAEAALQQQRQRTRQAEACILLSVFLEAYR